MKSSRPLARPSLVALAITLALPTLASALTLDETLRLAEQQAPDLQARAANTEAARQAAIPAGELPDPRLSLGIRNLPIEGDPAGRLDAEAMTMQTIGLVQEVPNRAKRRARTEAAGADIELAQTQQQLSRLEVRRQAAEAWITARSVEEKLELFKALYDENRLFERAVQARIAGGGGGAADSVQPKQEAALLAEQEDQLQRNRQVARAALRRWIGEAAGQPLSGELPSWSDEAAYYQHHLQHHPSLEAYGPLARQAEARLQEAIADKRPDWAWGVEYGRREAYGDMVSFNVSFDLPVFAGSRQTPRIASERARLSQVEAEREAALRMHNEALATDLAELERLQRTLARLDSTLVPLAEEKVHLSMADYRGGRGGLTPVVEAREALLETRLRRIDVARDRALANARLHFAFGADQ
ncbi:TolC family protein [Stutzerimonas stutzeri]|uniref:TolC family protein n=1 Tax=Stutzerimonas stutzeri TaxID=316 RepID=UPI001C2E13A4|nr:TolC family protein [Stutzerimonas stutzeri]